MNRGDASYKASWVRASCPSGCGSMSSTPPRPLSEPGSRQKSGFCEKKEIVRLRSPGAGRSRRNRSRDHHRAIVQTSRLLAGAQRRRSPSMDSGT